MGKSKQKIDETKTIWYEPKDWKIKNNTARKKGNTKEGSHPSLEVGENGRKRANLGLTTKSRRGHHKNTQLSRNPNPKDSRTAYVRNDLQYDDKKHLKEVMKGYRELPDSDKKKVLEIIKKRQSKK